MGYPWRTEKPASHRLLALDAFRGFVIAGMIVVNTPGSWAHVYPPLLHAEWHGWTFTDTIFPFFLFIVGGAMALSFARRLEAGATAAKLLLHSLRRGTIIVALGFLSSAVGYFAFQASRFRVPGILQRIGVCFLLASVLVLFLRPRGRIVSAALLLLGYWELVVVVPVPGHGAGNLDKVWSLPSYVDRAVLGKHTWKPEYDPEGLLSTLPATATVLMGYFAGEAVRRARGSRERLLRLLLGGMTGMLVGWLWGFLFPINKSLWTSSYTVFMSGMAAATLAVFLWLIDDKGWRMPASPFVWLGMNSIFLFLASGFGAIVAGAVKVPDAGKQVSLHSFLFEHLYASWLSPKNASLAFALTYLLFWIGIAWVLYRKKIFIKI